MGQDPRPERGREERTHPHMERGKDAQTSQPGSTSHRVETRRRRPRERQTRNPPNMSLRGTQVRLSPQPVQVFMGRAKHEKKWDQAEYASWREQHAHHSLTPQSLSLSEAALSRTHTPQDTVYQTRAQDHSHSLIHTRTDHHHRPRRTHRPGIAIA